MDFDELNVMNPKQINFVNQFVDTSLNNFFIYSYPLGIIAREFRPDVGSCLINLNIYKKIHL